MANNSQSTPRAVDPAPLRFSRAFLRHRHAVTALFAVLTAVCLMCIPLVKVNYSMTDYLPEDSASTVALNTMEDVYGSGIPNVELYAQSIDLASAQELSTQLADIDGINEVMWLGTQVDVQQPLAIQDQQAVDRWKTDDGYLFQLVVDEASGEDVLSQVRTTVENAGGTAALAGSLTNSVAMQESTSREIPLIMIAAVAIVIVILLITSHSWFEPVVFLIPIGVAIVMNMGTNLVLGEISFVSQICGAVLQLAVSMDYAIVFLHRFRNMQQDFADPLEAMAHCMQRSFTIELSSAAVTFFGFLALTVMRFGIGINLGIVLAKGIALSFVSVILFMPCLILETLPVLDRFEHRYLVPSLDRLSAGIQRGAIPVAIVIVALAIPCSIASGKTDFVYGAGDSIAPDSQAGQESALIKDAFGSAETWVLMVPQGRWDAEVALVDQLKQLDHVSGVTSYVTVAGNAMPVEVVPADTLSQVISGGWSRIVITTDVEGEGDDAFALVETVRESAADLYGNDYLLAGNAVSTYDLRDTVTEDSSPVKLFTVLSIGIVLALMFKSVSIPLLIVASIEISIWINLAVPYFNGEHLSYIGYLVIDSVQMGAAVDYAIVLAREYFDRRQHTDAVGASIQAVSYAGVPIATSAAILVLAGLGIHFISSNSIISQIGALISRGAFIAMLMMYLFLPLLFRLFDKLVQKTSKGLVVYKEN